MDNAVSKLKLFFCFARWLSIYFFLITVLFRKRSACYLSQTKFSTKLKGNTFLQFSLLEKFLH